MVLIIYMFAIFYFFFLQKPENNRLKKASWPKFCNIIFLFLLKLGSVGPVGQQIDFILSYVFPLKFICDHFFISPLFTRVSFLTVTSLVHLSGNAPDKYDKIIVLIFSQWSQCSMLLLVICGGFSSRRFSYLDISVALSPYS